MECRYNNKAPRYIGRLCARDKNLNVLSDNYLYSLIVKCLATISKERLGVLVLKCFLPLSAYQNKYKQETGIDNGILELCIEYV